MTKQNVALVVGSTGIVGEALTELLSKPDTRGGPWKVYGLARRPRPDWLSPEDAYIQPTELENIEVNGAAFRHALDALLPVAKNLEHIALQTGGKQYVGSFEAIVSGVGVVPYVTPFTENLPRQQCPNFYHALEDILFETVEKKQGKVTWSVHRPGVIFGLAAGNLMNFLGSLGVYAAICKHEGLPFAFPGNQFAWESVSQVSNSDLIAEQEIWAATDPRGKNEAFNTMNGDVFKWKKLWQSLAEKLGLEYVPYSGQPTPLGQIMKDKDRVWDKIVQESGLHPAKLEEVGHWWFVEGLLNANSDSLMSMNKSKEHGFFGFRNTEKTFLSFFDKMKERKLIP